MNNLGICQECRHILIPFGVCPYCNLVAHDAEDQEEKYSKLMKKYESKSFNTPKKSKWYSLRGDTNERAVIEGFHKLTDAYYHTFFANRFCEGVAVGNDIDVALASRESFRSSNTVDDYQYVTLSSYSSANKITLNNFNLEEIIDCFLVIVDMKGRVLYLSSNMPVARSLNPLLKSYKMIPDKILIKGFFHTLKGGVDDIFRVMMPDPILFENIDDDHIHSTLTQIITNINYYQSIE